MNINQFSKSETAKQQLEELKNKEKFDNLAEEARAKTKIGELEQKSIEIVKLLEGFGARIPIMIEALDSISKDMETENFKKMLTKLYDSIYHIEGNQHLLQNEVNNMRISLNKYLEKTEKETVKILNTYHKKSSLGKFLNWVIIVTFLTLSFICGKTILKTQDNINLVNNRMLEIHRILKQEDKYWYDVENRNIYLRELENIKKKNIEK